MRLRASIGLLLSLLILPIVGNSQTLFGTRARVSDRTQQRIVRRVLRYYFKPTKREKTILLEGAVRTSWLPKIRGIRFQILNEKERASYGPVYTFFEPEVIRKRYQIAFGIYDPGAGGSGDLWRFSFSGGRLRIWKSDEEWGSSGNDFGAGERFQ